MESTVPIEAAPALDAAAPLAERLSAAEFAVFYERVAPRLRGYLRAQTGDPSVADDLLQETFARVLASRFAPESDEHFVRYLYRAAGNLLADRARAAFRAPAPLEDAPEPAIDPAPPGLRRDLGRAFAALAPRERRLLWLAHVEGLDHREIGETVGVRAASVRVLLFRARRRLAALLDRAPAGAVVSGSES